MKDDDQRQLYPAREWQVTGEKYICCYCFVCVKVSTFEVSAIARALLSLPDRPGHRSEIQELIR